MSLDVAIGLVGVVVTVLVVVGMILITPRGVAAPHRPARPPAGHDADASTPTATEPALR
jgi:hypothetical protein